MPVADILIGQPNEEPELPLVAIVDSGSDGTAIPLQVLQRLNLRVKRRVYMHGVAGGIARVVLYVASLRIAGRIFDQVDVVGRPYQHGSSPWSQCPQPVRHRPRRSGQCRRDTQLTKAPGTIGCPALFVTTLPAVRRVLSMELSSVCAREGRRMALGDREVNFNATARKCKGGGLVCHFE